MTQAKAAAVVAALVNAGYVATISTDQATPANWRIVLDTSDGVAAGTVANFASNQGVTALVTGIAFT